MDKPGSTTTNTLDLSHEEVTQGQSTVRDVALGVGEVLTLKLRGTSGSTGYSWTADAQIGDPTVVQQTSHQYVRPPGPLIGGSGTDVWTIHGIKGWDHYGRYVLPRAWWRGRNSW